MTVNYAQDVATERVGGFFRLLFRWRGSIYKHIYGEISIFMILYGLVSVSYRFLMDERSRRYFEKFCKYSQSFSDYVPVTFVVGFYVVRVIVRRWTQWENMPWPDRLAFDISVYIDGADVRSRMVRRTLVRYCNLGSILCFRDICIPVRKRFPQYDNLLVAGLITPTELEVYEKISSKWDVNWWIPFHWAYTLLLKAWKENKLHEGAMMRLHDDIQDLRNRCWVLFQHDWIPIPMVYTQVCTLSVYLYMMACLFGRQYLMDKPDNLDLVIPIFTIFQLVFYLGWMKVAEVLINPLGMDADDFDVNYIIDRNLRTAFSVVDYSFNCLPPLEKDVHWDQEDPHLPHTENSKDAAAEPFKGSATAAASSQSSSETGGSKIDLSGDNDTKQLLTRKASRASSVASISGRSRSGTNLGAAFRRQFQRLVSRQPTVTVIPDLESEFKLNLDHPDNKDVDSLLPSPLSPIYPPLQPSPGQEPRKRHHTNVSTSTLPKIDEVPPPDNYRLQRTVSDKTVPINQAEVLLDLLADTGKQPETVPLIKRRERSEPSVHVQGIFEPLLDTQRSWVSSDYRNSRGTKVEEPMTYRKNETELM